jgi:hypothetical protein
MNYAGHGTGIRRLNIKAMKLKFIVKKQISRYGYETAAL